MKGAGLYAAKRALGSARGAADKMSELGRKNRERMWVNAKKDAPAGN
jgi:hypothetical protein